MNEDSGITRRDALRGIGTGSLAMTLLAKVPASASTESMSPPTLRRGYADGLYGQLHYRQAGPGTSSTTRPPLLCLHPSPLSGIVYDNWLIEMGRDRLALAPDTPGYGGSDAPAAPPQIADYANAMVRFLDQLHLGAVDVMGYHTGSMTAVDLAGRFPARVRKVVMISAPLYTPEERTQLLAGLAPTPSYEALLAGQLERWRRSGKGLFRDEPTDDRYADIQLDRMRVYRISTWGHRAAFSYDLAAAFEPVRQPILLLNPEDDVWTVTPRAMKYAKTATRHDLPGWTHGHLDAHTAEMAMIVRNFLDRNG
jgi:pimeloyl-ACP methyl ester carboxylesterase